MRIDKYLCENTSLTRSIAKKLLRQGEITCDGEMVKSASFKVSADMEVCIDGVAIPPLGERYIMLHKPKDTICSTVDEVYPSVINFLDIEKPETLHIAGRLDADTTGLVLITSDGQWSHNVTSPRKECQKRYRVTLADGVDVSLVEDFKAGIQLRSEEGLTKPAKLELIDSHNVWLTISEGKYHQVKRMFAAVGNKVMELHRQSVGEIELDDELELGEWRYLTEAEIASVK